MKSLLLLMAVFSSGERETIAILSARVRYGLSQRPEMPDQPPNIELRNLKNGASGPQVKEDASKGNASQPAQDKGRSLVDYDLLEARYEIEDLRREAEIAKGNAKASADRLAQLYRPAEIKPPLPPMSMLINEQQSDAYDVLVAVASWCGPCHSQESRNGDGDEFVRFHYIDIEHPPKDLPNGWLQSVSQLMRRLEREGGSNIPLTTWFDSRGKIQWVRDSSITTAQVRAKIENPENFPPKKPVAYGARGNAAGAIKGKPQVDAVLAWWAEHIGDSKATFTWKRNGARTLPLFHLQQATAEDLFGTFGEFTLKTDSDKTPFGLKELRLGYRITGEDVELTTLTTIKKSLLTPGKDTTETVAVGAQPVGSVTGLLTIISVIQTLWSLANPTFDVVLPGEISMSGQMKDGQLVVDTVGPSLRIVVLMTFTPRLDQVVIGPDKVRFNFGGSFIRSREFVVE